MNTYTSNGHTVIEVTNQPLCDRCHGTGLFRSGYGQCFACNGSGHATSLEDRAAAFTAAHIDDINLIVDAMETNTFCRDLMRKLAQYGSLSPRQLEAGANSARRIVANRATAANSKHVGTVKERRIFVLTIVRAIELPPRGIYGETPRYVFLCDDDAGNRVVYFGAAACMPTDPGEVVRVRASVKEHTERDGVAQTIIQRPMGVPMAPSAPAQAIPES